MRGDYVAGAFLEPEGEPLVSVEPAHDGRPVCETAASPARIAEAVAAAREASPAWAALSVDERFTQLRRFRAALDAQKEALADAIVKEIGKIRSEARLEVTSLVGRFDLALDRVKNDLRSGPLPGFPSEALRWHPHGVVGVIGPFNFPMHLSHAHIVPALLLGNAIVLKPSEVAPLCAIRYAEAAHAAGLPPGVLNVVQGRGAAGAALAAHPDVRGLAFTGSWPVGRRILEASLDRPEMLLALEMGGKNTAIVCEDADLRQAVHEIVIGGYLTTGQRCTCTDRVLVHRSRRDELVAALRRLVPTLVFGDPDDARAFAGPLATASGRDKLEAAIATARARGADAIVEGERLPGGFFRSGSVHLLPSGVHDLPGYTDVELFGPDLGIEVVDDDDEAIAAVDASPYGFACSVFTGSDARFERYFRGIRLGLLNRNRSTNQASPRLPFGGTGRSGNFRPAGSFAARNLAVPVAVQSNALGSFPLSPALRAQLPPPDLDRLEAMHEREEDEEAARSLLETPRPLRTLRPLGGQLPRSTALLERLSANERVAREKKPLVVDHLRSHGPWLVSVDDAPLSVLDSMSQTSTLPFGLADDTVVRSYLDGGFGDAVLRSHAATDETGRVLRERYAMALRARLPGLATVSFCGSGAEANEKALALCRAAAPAGATKVLAFEGGFHGVTLLALAASHEPAHRRPYDASGEHTVFSPWPTWAEPGPSDPLEPPALRVACTTGEADVVAKVPDGGDPLLAAELASLAHVCRTLATGEIYAVVTEPMQSAGGDRHVTSRFLRGLRLVTRAHGVPLVLDEAQCGFGLGGPLAWHERAQLVDARGEPDVPDCVVFAKRAQLGVVMSRLPETEATEAFPASLVRGLLHLSLVGERDDAARVEALVRARLPELVRRFGHRVGAPRAIGFALAFDLTSPADLAAYLGQRFWRGAVAFAAGDRTVRYRLSAAFKEAHVEALFAAIFESLAWLDAHPHRSAPAWEDAASPPAAPHAAATAPIEVRLAGDEDQERVIAAILALEEQIYEPARRDPESRLRLGFAEGGVVAIAEKEGALVGYAVGVPLERVAEIAGPDRDPARGRNDTLYTVALSVAPGHGKTGMGHRLKQALMRGARARATASGAPRYRFVSGRNRVGHADAMSHINDALGAHTLFFLDKQYGDDGVARYYRQPLAQEGAIGGVSTKGPAAVELHAGHVRPLAEPPASLVRAEARGLLLGPSVQKLVLSHYVTPAVVRATEHLAQLAPDLPHLVLASSRDEAIDRVLRMMRLARKGARIALGLEGAYVGHTTAAARSLGDPALHRGGPAIFSWPRLPHPALVGVEAALEALRAAIASAGAEAVLGIVVETVGERSGLVLPEPFLVGLGALRAATGVPVALVETACAYHRSGRGPFASSASALLPDAIAWWTGGQLGVVHVGPRLFAATPHALAGTWDGDELSLVQAQHQLRATRRLDLAPAIAALDSALEPARRAGLDVRGLGLHRVIAAGVRGEPLAEALAARGVQVALHPGGHVAIVPALDRAERDAPELERALAEWVAG